MSDAKGVGVPSDRTRQTRNRTDTQPIPKGSRGGGIDEHLSSRWYLNLSEDAVASIANEFRRPDLSAFILQAIDENRSYVDDQLPREQGYRSPAWVFAARLRGHPVLADLDPWEAVRIVDRTLETRGGWTLLPDHDLHGNPTDPREDFLSAWGKVRRPLSVIVVPGDVVAVARDYPLQSRRWASDHDARYRDAVSLCFWYAQALNDQCRFFLACRTLHDLIGTSSHHDAAKLLGRAASDGESVLAVLEKGQPPKRASRYRFIGDVRCLGAAVQ